MGRRLGVRRGNVRRLIQKLLVPLFEPVEPLGQFEEPLAKLAQSGVVFIGAAIGKELGFLDSAGLIFVHILPGSHT